jgi:hypothetical protein
MHLQTSLKVAPDDEIFRLQLSVTYPYKTEAFYVFLCFSKHKNNGLLKGGLLALRNFADVGPLSKQHSDTGRCHDERAFPNVLPGH